MDNFISGISTIKPMQQCALKHMHMIFMPSLKCSKHAVNMQGLLVEQLNSYTVKPHKIMMLVMCTIVYSHIY